MIIGMVSEWMHYARSMRKLSTFPLLFLHVFLGKKEEIMAKKLSKIKIKIKNPKIVIDSKKKNVFK